MTGIWRGGTASERSIVFDDLDIRAALDGRDGQPDTDVNHRGNDLSRVWLSCRGGKELRRKSKIAGYDDTLTRGVSRGEIRNADRTLTISLSSASLDLHLEP